ncbi:cytochrome P450 [Xylariales sp. AK1849]|nr:cytochrome P450 [Xylariales sp. AK1849]
MKAAYPFAQLPFAASAIIIGFVSFLYLAYQWALPKPLPGIPYNKAAVKTIFGDAAELSQIRKNGGRARAWFNQQTARHQAPLVQAFLAPLAKPILILSDFREANDILLRRNKEFDRAARNLDSLGGVIKYHHIGMRTSNPQFKANRELVKDLMTPLFLNTVSGPEIHRNALKFIDLWKLKARMANGRPFKAEDDVHAMTFDIIKVVAVGGGSSQSMTELYTESVLSSGSESQHPNGKDEVFNFPPSLPNEDLTAHQIQQDAVGASLTQPSPALFHKMNNCTPALRRAFASKNKMLEKQVSLAVKRLEAGEEVKSALDYMIKRELNSAEKASRNPVFDSPYMYDELYGYIGAGHDTSSTAFQWGLKHLANHQAVQRKLREALRAAYSDAAQECRQPSVVEITKSHVPYLEAVIEEILRLSGPIALVIREATVDTTVLGHPIPKGTQVFLSIEGPSFTAPGFSVDESSRSESSRSHKDARGTWDDASPEDFIPERWMIAEEGDSTFDSQAGPFLAFSQGVRGCFGRRLAYLELRILMALLIWNFELGQLPAALNTWDAVDSLTIKPAKCFVRLSEAR